MATSFPPRTDALHAPHLGARPRLGAAELRRRFWHIAPGFLPLVMWFVPHRDPLSPFMLTVFCSVVAGFGLNAYFRYGRIARSGDGEKPAAVLGYTLSIILSLVLFQGAAEIGLTVLAILAFGDGPATLGGLYFGGPRLPWNPSKTWSGFACFLLVGIPMATLVYWGETNFNLEVRPPATPLGTSLLVVGTAVTAAAVMESLRLRVNDNIRVGATAAIVLAAMHGLLGGWQ